MKQDHHTKTNIDFYDHWSKSHKNKDLLKFNKAAEYEFRKVIEQLNLSKKRKVIEFGAGLGRYSLALAKMGHAVTAVDVSRNCLNIIRLQAKKYGIENNVKTIRSDSASKVYKNEYDIALCMTTYQVVASSEEGRIKILSNFLTSLKPGGTLLLVESNPLNPLFYFFYLFYPNVQRENIRNFLGSSPFRLRRVLESLGMKSIQVRYVGFFPLRWIKIFPPVALINEVINKIPILNSFSAFSYITARK